MELVLKLELELELELESTVLKLELIAFGDSDDIRSEFRQLLKTRAKCNSHLILVSDYSISLLRQSHGSEASTVQVDALGYQNEKEHGHKIERRR